MGFLNFELCEHPLKVVFFIKLHFYLLLFYLNEWKFCFLIIRTCSTWWYLHEYFKPFNFFRSGRQDCFFFIPNMYLNKFFSSKNNKSRVSYIQLFYSVAVHLRGTVVSVAALGFRDHRCNSWRFSKQKEYIFHFWCNPFRR